MLIFLLPYFVCTLYRKIDENEIWFDDVDEMLLENSNDCSKSTNHLVKPNSFKGLTKTVAMDCEMVGVGIDGVTSMLARTSIVNHFGNCIYDKYVKNLEKVTDFRTRVSAEKFSVVQKEVSDILKGRILVGHAISNDLKVLYLSHPKLQIRDTSKFKKFRRIFGGKTPSLRRLTERLLGVQIQDGEHSSIQDAQAAIRLYTLHRKEWESTIGRRKHRIKAKVSAKTSE
ncbi:RNA exonuclease 4 [Nymphon striatum]|nr:RNA exonuclease 4 [Nymphon striatum]KAG1678241.1 RNA exonuclease 4 [Nymphon striatum]